MPPPIAGSEVFIGEDLRRIFDALEVARPDLSEALTIVRIALGLERSARTARFNGAGRIVDAEWRVNR